MIKYYSATAIPIQKEFKMDPVLSGIFCIVSLVIFFGFIPINAYWEGKAEVKKEERLAAQANADVAKSQAKEAEAKAREVEANVRLAAANSPQSRDAVM